MSARFGFVTLVVLVLATSSTAAADVEAGRRKSQPCAACHGADGNSTNPTVPSLAGQRAIYIHWQLVLFRDQRRKDPQMSPFAANLSDADMADLGEYYEAQTPTRPPGVAAEPEKIAEGERLAETHHCGSCHAPQAPGQRYAPRLLGLHYEYLRRQLRGFKAQTRAELDGTMTTAAQPLSEQDIDNLARYLATLSPAP
jgi:cytochrome c553